MTTEARRRRLSNRRKCEAARVEFLGRRFHLTVGLYEDGLPGEVFIRGPKVGSEADGLLDDAAVLISLLLQHGVEPATIAASLARQDRGARASILGAVADHVANISSQKDPPHA